MDANDRVKHTIDRIVHDIDQIGSVVRSTEEDLNEAVSQAPDPQRWSMMRSRLSEVHARLDGLKEFALACERRMAGTATEEELDVWL